MRDTTAGNNDARFRVRRLASRRLVVEQMQGHQTRTWNGLILMRLISVSVTIAIPADGKPWMEL